MVIADHKDDPVVMVRDKDDGTISECMQLALNLTVGWIGLP